MFERILRGVGIFLVHLTWNYPQAKFVSLLMNGSTDKGNADDEVFMVHM